jgi:hypothetical protein
MKAVLSFSPVKLSLITAVLTDYPVKSSLIKAVLIYGSMIYCEKNQKSRLQCTIVHVIGLIVKLSLLLDWGHEQEKKYSIFHTNS